MPLRCALTHSAARIAVILATTACGEVTASPTRCDAPWCLVATAGEQRVYHSAVWTGAELLVWGGLGANDRDALATGLRITPSTGKVRPITTIGAPTARWSHFAAWTGDEMLIWGGESYVTDGSPPLVASAVGGSAYDPEADAWRSITDPRPGPVVAEAVAWTGTELFVWGGGGGSEQPRVQSGFLFEPSSNTARPTGEASPDAEAVNADAVALDGAVVITGGLTNFPEARPIRYDVAVDSWLPVASPPSVLGSDGVAAPVFGYDGKAYFCSRDLRLCGAYSIADDSWDELDLADALPPFEDWPAWAVADHRLVLFGSPDFGGPRTIATSYDFSGQRWQTLPTQGAPRPRRGQTATWIGDGVLFWGGGPDSGPAVPQEGWLLKASGLHASTE